MELERSSPRYFDLRWPDPVSIAQLQGGAHAPGLLKDNEALLVWLPGKDGDKGVVFAISRRESAWAELPMTGDEVTATVERIRRKIDPGAFRLRSVDGAQPKRSAQLTPEPARGGPGLRADAFKLYQALMGTPAIAKVIAQPGIDTLLVVASDALTALPPGLLVTQAPEGDDHDPDALRRTHWLIRDKAIAILPSVSALHTIRDLLPDGTERSTSGRPLLAFADPDFAGTGAVPGLVAAAVPVEPRRAQGVVGARAPLARSIMRDGRGRMEALARLAVLPGTLSEGVAIAKALGAAPADLLLGPAATETALRQRQEAGRLAAYRILSFSTHGLVSGDFTGLIEPALALAHPPPKADQSADDGLLTASEIAGLTLDADWVVLSACNTASPGADGGEGLSGLARSFFAAGARSLLVSHWRVRDDAAQALVAATVTNLKASGKAQALRLAMLGLMDNRTQDAAGSFADPQAWAPFVLVGEPSGAERPATIAGRAHGG